MSTSSPKRQFVPPMSLHEAEERDEEMKAHMRSIETQLANRDVRDPDTGERLSFEEYQTWRNKAMAALSFKRADHHLLKNWIKVERRRLLVAEYGTAPSTNDLMLHGMSILLRKFAAEDVEAKELAEAIENRLHHQPKAA